MPAQRKHPDTRSGTRPDSGPDSGPLLRAAIGARADAPIDPRILLGEDEEEGDFCVTYGKCVPHNVRYLIQEAMRIACDFDRTFERCRKKACRRTGRCHFDMNSEGVGVCGGGITRETEDRVVLMLYLICHIGIKARDE